MADVQKSAFALSGATFMLGNAFTDDVFSLTPDEHSVGMVSEASVVVDSSINELLNGVAQSAVDSKRTGVSSNVTVNVFEMTAKNFARGQALGGAVVTPKRGRLTAAAASAAVSLSIESLPLPGEATSAITAVGDIPQGATILLQRPGDETDYVFPTKASAAATGSGPYTVAIAAPYGIPANMSFPVGTIVWIIPAVGVADVSADDLFCVKITGVLTNYNRPVTYVAPKVRMVKGFQMVWNETQYVSMPWEMRPLLLSKGEVVAMARGTDIGTKRAGLIFPAA